jgi:hypothetical protein
MQEHSHIIVNLFIAVHLCEEDDDTCTFPCRHHFIFFATQKGGQRCESVPTSSSFFYTKRMTMWECSRIVIVFFAITQKTMTQECSHFIIIFFLAATQHAVQRGRR